MDLIHTKKSKVLERRKKEEFEKLENLIDQAALLPVFFFSNTSLAALGSSHTWGRQQTF